MEKLSTSLLTVSELVVTAERFIKALEPVKGETSITDCTRLVSMDLAEYDKGLEDDGSKVAGSDLKEYDHVRDRCFIALRDFIKANRSRSDAAISSAAAALYTIVKKHGTGLWCLGYTEESARLRDLFIDFDKPEAAGHIRTISADGWLDDLKAAQESFESFYQIKIEEDSLEQEPVSLKKAVYLLKKDIKLLLANVESIPRLRPGKTITDAIARLDEITIDIMSVAKARKSREENEALDIDEDM